MNIVYVGITHENAPIELRERLSFSKEDLKAALSALQKEKSILENVIISTCNRTEMYVLCDQIHTGQYYTKHFMANWFGVDFETLQPYIVIKQSEDVIEHLLLLSCGMKSKIFGESQILGQIREAYHTALECGTTGLYLNQLFQMAQRFGKKQQTLHKLSQRPRSISFQTMAIIQQSHDLQNKSMVIVGLGEIGELLVKHAVTSKIGKIYVVNRTFEKAVRVSHQNAERIIAKPMNALESLINECDFVVTAVGSRKPIINRDMLHATKDQTFFDLGLPRNILGVTTQNRVTYYNVDDIHLLLEKNQSEQAMIQFNIKADAYQEIVDFFKWEASLNVLPTIDALRNKMISHYDQVLLSLTNKLGLVSDHDRKVIQKHLKSLVNAMLKEPIKEIKELNNDNYGQYKLEFVKELFQLQVERSDFMGSNSESRVVTVGTRGSQLATIQTQMVIDQLQAKFPQVKFERKIITTKGDQDQTSSLSKIGGKGVFMKELERELIEGEIDIAVHSLKDVPSQIAEETIIASTPKRASAQECIIMKAYHHFSELPKGARIGTGSQRRVAQLKQLRPDLEFVDIRGNVETRINKLFTNNLDGVVLAVAGLDRSGFFEKNETLFVDYFDTQSVIPAVGQGSLAIQCRSQDEEVIQLVRSINHELTELCVQTERQFLSCLGLGCNYPIGAFATMQTDGNIEITGLLASKAMDQLIVETVISHQQNYQNLGQTLFDAIMEKGGKSLLQAYQQEQGESCE